MRAVLGIDAAWTLHNPSGVALAVEHAGGWRLIAAVSSYQHFHALADNRQKRDARPLGSKPNAIELLASANALGDCNVSLVAIDMPLSYEAITKSRASDRAVSRAFSARYCGAYTR